MLTHSLPLVLLPVQHIVVVNCDLGGESQPAVLADQDLLANLPVGAGLAFTNKKFNSLFVAHLQPPEFIFHFTHKIVERLRSSDTRLPAQPTINQIILFHDPRTGKQISAFLVGMAHEPEVIGH